MFLVDTNVMLAASAVNELSNLSLRAMPHEIELREQVYEWLADFDASHSRLVLDEEGLIYAEYTRNMPFNVREQEYGLQVLQNKQDRGLVDYVPIETLEANGEHVAVLEPQHEALVPDREDRKWVAAAFAAQLLHERVAPIVYGAETDWFVAEERLAEIGIAFVRLLPERWYRSKLPAP
ncbi:MAG: hypothetical protein FGM40_07780 [Rhodocyclaceae bacterium]|nr:hypothetical protein [Rhodocyclaceae bacterium]